jgi:hypothetical protein
MYLCTYPSLCLFPSPYKPAPFIYKPSSCTHGSPLPSQSLMGVIWLTHTRWRLGHLTPPAKLAPCHPAVTRSSCICLNTWRWPSTSRCPCKCMQPSHGWAPSSAGRKPCRMQPRTGAENAPGHVAHSPETSSDLCAGAHHDHSMSRLNRMRGSQYIYIYTYASPRWNKNVFLRMICWRVQMKQAKYGHLHIEQPQTFRHVETVIGKHN